jgi:hypothetical protein
VLTLGSGVDPNESLRLTSTGKIDCGDPAAAGASASDITINVPGNMVMEAGSAILAENDSDGGSGGDITIKVGGNFTMRGPDLSNPGAIISSRKTAGAGDTGGGGDIRITVGNVTVNGDDTITCATDPKGNIVMEAGSTITADANGEAGAIKMFAGKNVTINGTVRSQGFTSVGRGGPITIDACCDLVIGDTGVVSSRGADPGADLVHLQGCDVTIFGLVESTGPGHTVPPKNLCNDPNRPGKPANSTGCVEIWSGTTILIDATNGHHGEVNADVGQTGGPQGTGWIDILAHKEITITGNPTAPAAGTNNDTVPAYAVHANMAAQNGHGGVITVISTDTTVTTSGRAIQANSSTASNGGKGGQITVLASGVVAFGTAFIQAAGDTTGGGGQAGGSIFAHSFNAKVTGAAPGQLNATGPGGTVKLQGCGEVLADYSGTVIGTRTTDPTCTGGTPPLPSPADVQIPAGNCLARCQLIPGNKSGRKFNDINKNGVDDGEPGLPGWEIDVFDSSNTLFASTTTGPDGSYTFNLPVGTYTICEVLQLGWTQSAPCSAGGPPATCTGTPIPAGESIADCSVLGAGLGPRGYHFTIASTETHSKNDFGNFTVVECREDPNSASKLTRIVDQTLTPHGSLPVYATLQDAYEHAAANAGEVIGMFSTTVENVVLGNSPAGQPKTLTITQCTTARISAADSSLPVMDVTSTGKLTIIGPDTHGGTIGWRVAGNGGHSLKSIRADGASQYGVLVLSSNNSSISWNSLNSNAVGLRVESSGNNLKGGSVSSNTGDGVQIAGSNNSFQGATVESNGGNGVSVSGTGNTIKGNKANKNALAGFKTAASATGSKFGSNASNETSQGGSKENGGGEYDFAAGSAPVTNLLNNKADNVAVPTATKCPTLFSAGGVCE